MTICVFGDSTAWGAWDKEKGGWVNRLWLYVAEKESDDEIYNLSISGGTTETLLARFESESKIREADMLVFQTGGNDAAREGSREDANEISPKQFRKNLEEIILRAKRITGKLVFVGFENCDESKTTPVAWVDKYYLNDDIKKYNEIMRTVCEDRGVLFIDTFGLLDKNDFEDGLHPNASGHRKLFENIRDFLFDQRMLG